jgi:hypothetical protein
MRTAAARHLLPVLLLANVAACASESDDEGAAPDHGKYDRPGTPATDMPCEVIESSGIFDSFVPPVAGESFTISLEDPASVSIEFAEGYINIPSAYESTPHHEGFRLSSPDHSTVIDVSVSNAESASSDAPAAIVWIASDLATPAHNHFDHLVGRCR